jgi:hypothetical protein
MNLLESIVLRDFPTHVQMAKAARKKFKVDEKTGMATLSNPRAAGRPRFSKINGQKIYDGSVGKFERAKMIEGMHAFVRGVVTRMKISPIDIPVRLEAEIHVPWNFGGVKMVSGALNVPKEGKTRWDLLNVGWLWFKVFEDELTEMGILPDDDVSVVRSTGKITHVPIADFANRKLIFYIYEHDESEFSSSHIVPLRRDLLLRQGG